MRVVAIVLCCFLATAAVFAAAGAPEKPSLPDVFLVTIDTLRSDHVHCYGYEKIQTPTMDKLATQGIRFTQAFTVSPITNSSHTSILTGLMPSSHGVTDFGIRLTAEHATLAEILRKQGYRTAAFIGSVVLDSKTLAPGLDRGFEFYDNFPEKAETKSRWGRIERRGVDVVQRAENWLNQHRASPHFVWVHLYDPHDPYEPPAPFSETYKDRLYDGEIAYADSALGNFFAYLTKQGWYDGALVILVADHGEGLGEHHEETHGIFLYDSTTHVPLIVKLPNGREAGTVVENPARTTDIMPTILDVLGTSLPPNTDGASLMPAILAGETTPRTVLGETDYPLRFGWAPLRSVRKDGFKYIEAPQPEFYDLHADPREVSSHYEPWDPKVQKLRKVLAEWSAKLPPARKPSPAAVSSTTIDELHALGYLTAADARSSTDVPEPSLLPDPKDKIEEQNLLHVAMMASEDGLMDKARGALEKVMQLNERSDLGLSELGRLEMTSGNFAKAASYLRRLRELRPDDAVAAFDYGQCLEREGDLSGARDALQQSIKLDPNQYSARVLLGRVYFRLNDAKAAQDQLEAAALLQPDNLEAWFELAKEQMAQKNFADATEELEQLAEFHNDNSELYELLAQAYIGLGKSREAQQARSRAKAIDAQKPQKAQ